MIFFASFWGNMKHTLFPSLFCLLLVFLLSPVPTYGNIPTEFCSGEPEQMNKRADCVCWSQVLVESYSELIRISQTMKDKASEVIAMRIKYYFCHQFLQLPSHIEIEMSDSIPSPYSRLKRKYYVQRHRKLRHKRDLDDHQSHHRSKRQISLGFPTPTKWEEIIPHLPKQGRHYYAPVGALVTLKCFAGHDSDNQVGIQDRVDDASRTFEWKHANGMEITASYVTTDRASGDLSFHAVRLADTGIYNCTMETGQESGSRKEAGTYQSQLDVVAGPTYWLRFGMTYKTSRCKHKELLEIQRNVPNLVHKYACHFCTVRNVSMTCINFGDGGNQGKIVQLTLAMSALGFEEMLSGWNHNYVHCNLECQKSIHAKILQLTGESLVKLFSLQIHVLPVEGETSIYTPIPDSYDEDLADGCPPGFFLQYSLCFPCAPGRYSPTGPADCFACEKGHFQPNPGSSACFSCPKDHTTMKKGSRSQMDCVLYSASWWMELIENNWLIAIIIAIVLLLIILLLLLICCCWPNSRLGRWIRCVPCCGEEGCCGGNGEEKQIPEDQQYLLENGGRGFDSDGLSSDDEDRRFRRQTFGTESSEEEHDFRTSKKSSGENQNANKVESKQNVTLTLVSEDKSKTVLPKPNHLDLTNCPNARPVMPYPVRRGYCEATKRNLRRQRREQLLQEQQGLLEESSTDGQDEVSPCARLRPPPAFPHRNADGDGVSESSATRKFYHRNPHLKFGNILNKSKSLISKLAEQRRKLRHVARGGSESSEQKPRKTKSTSSLPSKAHASYTALKNKVKTKMVKISESSNKYHPANKAPCTTCSSNVFKKAKNFHQQNNSGQTGSKSWTKKMVSKSNSALQQLKSRSKEKVKESVKAIENKLSSKQSRKR